MALLALDSVLFVIGRKASNVDMVVQVRVVALWNLWLRSRFRTRLFCWNVGLGFAS
jgi:hypothetical protein